MKEAHTTTGRFTASRQLGHETVLHSFAESDRMADCPQFGGLININGTLYGETTEGGGAGSCGNGCGTIFEVDYFRAVRTCFTVFLAPPDDWSPGPVDLTSVNGTIYGTTAGGGIGMRANAGPYSQSMPRATRRYFTASPGRLTVNFQRPNC